MVAYTVVGFIVVWGIPGSLLIAGLRSFIRFWHSLTPRQQRIQVARVDFEVRRARRRMIAETLRQSKTEKDVDQSHRLGTLNGARPWSGQ